MAVAVPLSVYLLGLYLLYAALTRTLDPFHLLLVAPDRASWSPPRIGPVRGRASR